MIELIEVSKRYADGQQALTRINLNIDAGQMVFLTGHSGAGKSSLLRLLAMIDRCTQGKIIVDKTDLTTLPISQIPLYRRQIGVVFQSPTLLSDKSVFANVALPLQVCGLHKHDIVKRVRAALGMVGLLPKIQHNAAHLSCGEQQRLGIARAVVHKPTLLLADEPTGNLDPHLAAEIMHLFAKFNQVGVTVVVATHDLSLVEQLNYPVLTLQQGRLLGDASC